jgi:hypothetical protein
MNFENELDYILNNIHEMQRIALLDKNYNAFNRLVIMHLLVLRCYDDTENTLDVIKAIQ